MNRGAIRAIAGTAKQLLVGYLPLFHQLVQHFRWRHALPWYGLISACSERVSTRVVEKMSSSISSTVSSIDATQRKLFVGIVIFTLLALGIAIADLARGGRPDPPTLRAAATLLDGSWRFHTGDDPHWADADADDTGWGTIDMTAAAGSHDADVGRPDYVSGWRAHGHPGYDGYAWYRRAVSVPAGHEAWDILGPSLVEDGYEL